MTKIYKLRMKNYRTIILKTYLGTRRLTGRVDAVGRENGRSSGKRFLHLAGQLNHPHSWEDEKMGMY